MMAGNLAAAGRAHHHVLVVDDNEDVRDGFVTLLRLEGFEVAAAAGVDEALGQLHHGLKPCVVFLDLHMPDRDGWSLTAEMQQDPALAGVPVVVVSGVGLEPQRALEHGIRELLRKPVEPANLVDAVRRHCAGHPGGGQPASPARSA